METELCKDGTPKSLLASLKFRLYAHIIGIIGVVLNLIIVVLITVAAVSVVILCLHIHASDSSSSSVARIDNNESLSEGAVVLIFIATLAIFGIFMAVPFVMTVVLFCATTLRTVSLNFSIRLF